MILERMKRHLVCKPVSEIMPTLYPTGPLQEAIIASLQLERTKTRNGILILPRKPLKLKDAVEILSWFGLREGKDILTYPSTVYVYKQCDPYSNTVMAYIAPILTSHAKPPVRLLVPEADYILSTDELVDAIKTIVRRKRAKIYVLSKYARPGNLFTFIKNLETARLELYIASESRIVKKYKPTENVWVVGTQSHRKLLLIVIDDTKPTLVAYRGSMNIFYPGVDDYLEAVSDWNDMKRLLHGLFRAFLIV